MNPDPKAVRTPDDPRLTPILLRRELWAAGWSDKRIAREVRAGILVRVRWGAYVDGFAWRQLDAVGRYELRVRAAVRQANAEVHASHTSGLPLFEAPIWGLDLADVHLTRADARAGRREAGVRQHRGLILPGDVVERHGVSVMHPTRLALEVTMLTTVEPALVVVNDLLHRALTTPERLAERFGRGMNRWEGSNSTDVVLRLADPRIESVGESRTFYMMWKYGGGLPMPQCNHIIPDEHGRELWRVDFAWPELRLFLEFDGREKYLKRRREGESVTDAVLREKRRQELIERFTGWRCVRIIWADLERPQHTVAMIRSAMERSAAA